jgi:predicted permease
MLLGAILYRVGVINEDFNKRLTKILLNVTMPALILDSVLKQTGSRDFSAVILIFAIAIVTYLLLPAISLLFVWVCKIPMEDKGLYIFMTVYSNVGFMGFPVLQALLGSTAVFYAAIFNIVFNLSIYTHGIIMIHYGRLVKAPLNWKSLISPGFLGSVVAIVLYFTDLKVPFAISKTLDSVGALTVPLAMMIIGATLATMNLKELFDDWKLYPYALFRQIVIPITCFFILKLCIRDTFILNISAILLMMPAANTAVLFANEYGGNEKTAAKAVFFTTILSVFTIPALIYIFL